MTQEITAFIHLHFSFPCSLPCPLPFVWICPWSARMNSHGREPFLSSLPLKKGSHAFSFSISSNSTSLVLVIDAKSILSEVKEKDDCLPPPSHPNCCHFLWEEKRGRLIIGREWSPLLPERGTHYQAVSIIISFDAGDFFRKSKGRLNFNGIWSIEYRECWRI